MAKYEKCTQKQKEVLDVLTYQAQIYRRKADELIRKRNEKPAMLFEENQRSRKAIAELEKKYKDTTDEINNILDARNEMQLYLDKAQRYIKMAESIKQTWGFE